jgi:hypothetical protein
MLVGNLVRMASKRQPGQHLPKEKAKKVREAAEWLVKGGSPWRSSRDLADHFDVHHSTTDRYVLQAKQ